MTQSEFKFKFLTAYNNYTSKYKRQPRRLVLGTTFDMSIIDSFARYTVIKSVSITKLIYNNDIVIELIKGNTMESYLADGHIERRMPL